MSWSEIVDRIKNDGEKGSEIIKEECRRYLKASEKVKELEKELSKWISESNNAIAVIGYVKKIEEITRVCWSKYEV